MFDQIAMNWAFADALIINRLFGFQVIASGKVRGWKDQDTPNGRGKYNSEMTIDSFESAPWAGDYVEYDTDEEPETGTQDEALDELWNIGK